MLPPAPAVADAVLFTATRAVAVLVKVQAMAAAGRITLAGRVAVLPLSMASCVVGLPLVAAAESRQDTDPGLAGQPAGTPDSCTVASTPGVPTCTVVEACGVASAVTAMLSVGLVTPVSVKPKVWVPVMLVLVL